MRTIGVTERSDNLTYRQAVISPSSKAMRKPNITPSVAIITPRRFTDRENKTYSRLQWVASLASVANLFYQGYIFAKTLSWLPALYGASQAVLTTVSIAIAWSIHRGLQYQTPRASAPLQAEPKVALTLTALSEPAEMVRASLLALWNVDYGARDVFFLDDSIPGTQSALAYQSLVRDLAEKGVSINHLRRKDDPAAFQGGYKAGNINHFLNLFGQRYEYFVPFDADFRPSPDFLGATIPIMESPEGSHTAVLQTAQQYGHEPEKPIVEAECLANEVWLEVLHKGRNEIGVLSWLGSGAVIRTKALFEAAAERGEPEAPIRTATILEDKDTSIGLTFESSAAWEIHFLDRYLAVGIQPETFLRNIKRQYRWTLGATQVIRKRLVPLLPRLISGGNYEKAFACVGDVLTQLTNIQSFVVTSAVIGFSFLAPNSGSLEYLFASGLATLTILASWAAPFYKGLKHGYGFNDIMRYFDLQALRAPACFEAAAQSFISKEHVFETTNTTKTGHERIPLKWLLPNLTFLGLSIAALFYTLGDGIASAISFIEISYSILIIKTAWLLHSIRGLSKIAEFNDGWKATFSDLWAGLKPDREQNPQVRDV